MKWKVISSIIKIKRQLRVIWSPQWPSSWEQLLLWTELSTICAHVIVTVKIQDQTSLTFLSNLDHARLHHFLKYFLFIHCCSTNEKNDAMIHPDEYFVCFQFDVEDHPDVLCPYDYVRVSDGRKREIKPLCGKTLPRNITSSGNYMHIEFVTDGSGNYKGFSAFYDTHGNHNSNYFTFRLSLSSCQLIVLGGRKKNQMCVSGEREKREHISLKAKQRTNKIDTWHNDHRLVIKAFLHFECIWVSLFNYTPKQLLSGKLLRCVGEIVQNKIWIIKQH